VSRAENLSKQTERASKTTRGEGKANGKERITTITMTSKVTGR